MWLPDRTKLLKIRLHNQGEDAEGVWVEDLGPALLHPEARYVRIGNVPVFHAKPTYGDVIEVRPDEDGMLAWDRDGADFDEIGACILEDGGRWVAIIDYWPSRTTSTLESTYKKFDVAALKRDIVIESVVTMEGRGCAYLAVPKTMSLDELVTWLESRRKSMGFKLRHPGVGADDDEDDDDEDLAP